MQASSPFGSTPAIVPVVIHTRVAGHYHRAEPYRVSGNGRGIAVHNRELPRR